MGSKGEAMCESETQMIEMCDGSTKVRKPYTITKQREKWTEEEHQKFLEALKLFGRGWRQIEEHIGTKTAVQIRSHAQKFFSKVVRGMTESVEGSARPIEIPPPRPKRKPVHPYPRKSAADPKQQESSPSPKSSVPEKGTKSPTSVLSCNGSDSGSSALYHLNRSLSATSCSNDVYSISRSPSKNEANHLMLNSYIEEKKPSAKRQLSSCSIVEDLAPMVFEVDEKKTSHIKEQEMSASGGLKLFGRTLLLSNSQKEISAPTVEEDQTLKAHQGFGLEPSLDQLDTRLSLGVVSNFTPLDQYKENYNVPKTETPVLWLNLYQVPFQYLGSYSPSQDQLAPNSCAEGKPSNKERSCTDSNEGSTSSGIDTLVGKVSEAVDSISQPHKYSIVESFSSRKGFVPYKRCVAERENTSNDRETQKIRVC